MEVNEVQIPGTKIELQRPLLDTLGQYVPNTKEQMPKHFFITLDTYEENWYGHLTIGQPCYLWSSADVGDAHLVDTDSCKTLEHAIATLQGDIGSLLRAFSAL